MKKQWGKPSMLVIVRNKPEETVLDYCKTAGGGGAASALNLCRYAGAAPGTCSPSCDTHSATS